MDEYHLTRENIQRIGEKFIGRKVTSYYCKCSRKWIEHDYEIAGFEDHGSRIELTLKHLNGKLHLYEGSKIQIYEPLVKGISAMSISPPLPGPKYGGGGGGGR